MANLKLSQLPAAFALTGTEILPVVQAGQTRSTTVAAMADLRKGTWQAPSLNAPWTNYGETFANAAYRKDGNRVQLRGLVKAGASGSVIFTLPAGFRPSAQQIYVANCDAATPARVDIRSNGEVIVSQSPTGTLGELSLDGVAFFAE